MITFYEIFSLLKLDMGNYKVVNKHVDNTKLPRMYPEPDY